MNATGPLRRLTSILIAATVFVAATVWAPTAALAATSHLPGTFAVSIKGQLPGTGSPEARQFARLAFYSFREPSTDPTFRNLRMDAWIWTTTSVDSDTIADCPAGSLIGYVADGSYPDALDANTSVQCAQKGLGEPSFTRYGTYCGPDAANPNAINPGDIFTIYWHDVVPADPCSGPYFERWRYRSDLDGGKLAMIEMLDATNVDTSVGFYAKADGTYDPDAINVGWGFGSRGIGTKHGKTSDHLASQIELGTKYYGYMKTWNNWCTDPSRRNGSVIQESINASSQTTYKPTNGTYNGAPSPKVRYFIPKSAADSYDVYGYLAVPDNQLPGGTGLTDRRIVFTNGHDWEDNGHIEDNSGHAKSGLQIINSDDELVGFVFVEVGYNETTANGGYDTLSALYYVRQDLTPTDPVGTVRC